jgi:hypothetical protein
VTAKRFRSLKVHDRRAFPKQDKKRVQRNTEDWYILRKPNSLERLPPIPICIQAETEAAARSPTRERVPGRTQMYVEESDSGASCKDAATTKVCT